MPDTWWRNVESTGVGEFNYYLGTLPGTTEREVQTIIVWVLEESPYELAHLVTVPRVRLLGRRLRPPPSLSLDTKSHSLECYTVSSAMRQVDHPDRSSALLRVVSATQVAVSRKTSLPSWQNVFSHRRHRCKLEDDPSSCSLCQLWALSFLLISTLRNPTIPMERREPTFGR
jgi:hypothetical protein